MFISLGCDKNTVDTEYMLGLLRNAGFSLTNEEEDADVIVVNTCAFIGDAKQESVNTIIEAAQYKQNGKLQKLVVTGCLAERYKDEILSSIPEVDAVVGTTAYDKIVEAVTGKDKVFMADLNALPLPDCARVCTTGGYYSYLKIAEGCDKRCTYCIIPTLRGSYRSVPMERLVKEAEFLAEGGTKELILVAQETTVYGKDIYGKKMLPELLRKLSKIDGIEWIRLLYCYPEEIDDDLIKEIKTNKKVCHYLDLPIQHISDGILKRMGRRTSGADIKALIKKLREEIPDIALRTSIITGFPGEKEKDQKELLSFVKQAKFTRLGCFVYSREDGTPAAKFADKVNYGTRVRRRNEVMRLQRDISCKNSSAQVGKTLRVMVSGKIAEDDVWVGRSYMDAPNVDGYVFFESPDSYLSGDFVDVEITSASDYDLYGKAVEF